MSKHTPKDITRDAEGRRSDIASFDYYSGIAYASDKGLEQTTSFKDVHAGTHFMVCCGDVMASVKDTDYPEIERRIL